MEKFHQASTLPFSSGRAHEFVHAIGTASCRQKTTHEQDLLLFKASLKDYVQMTLASLYAPDKPHSNLPVVWDKSGVPVIVMEEDLLQELEASLPGEKYLINPIVGLVFLRSPDATRPTGEKVS